MRAPETMPAYVATLYADMSEAGRVAFLQTARTMAAAGKAERSQHAPTEGARRHDNDARPYPYWLRGKVGRIRR